MFCLIPQNMISRTLISVDVEFAASGTSSKSVCRPGDDWIHWRKAFSNSDRLKAGAVGCAWPDESQSLVCRTH